MDSYCRLCAKVKSPAALKHRLSDIATKLIDCCHWIEPYTGIEYPQNICVPCAKRLDQSWKFNEAVKNAQIELDHLIHQHRQDIIFIKEDEADEVVKVEPDYSSDMDFSVSEVVAPEKAEFLDFRINAEENTSDFEWPDNNDDDWGADDDGARGAELENDSSILPIDLLNEECRNDVQENDTGDDVKKNNCMKKRQEFIDQIGAEWRLDDGKILPDRIMELKVCDWSVYKFKCWVCKLLVDTGELLRAHFIEAHSDSSIKWECSICPFGQTITKKQWQLQVHVANQHYPHLFYCCPKCSIFFWHKKKMRKHCNNKLRHNNNDSIPCEVCGKIFRSNLLLKLHHQNRHVPQDRQFECYLCKKSLSKLQVCKAHMKRFHFDGDAYQAILVMCELCGKVCKSAGSLSSHMVTHNTEMFSCDICDKKFKSARGVKKHQICHSDEKQFSCKECDFQTRRIESLKNHMRIHRNERRFECDICFKKFTLSNGLRVHRRIHTGEKPYACTICEYRSVNGPNLNKHMKQVHGTTFFKARSTNESKAFLVGPIPALESGHSQGQI